MQVEVRGALRFQHRAGLDKGVVAFDDHAYPEFFKSELWSLAGPFATCETKFDIEPDCDYSQAFLAMARCALDGMIEFREPKARDLTRLVKAPKLGWMSTTVDAKVHAFGSDTAKLAATWADKLAAAKAADAANEVKAAKKAKVASVLVELPFAANAAVVRPDGSLAVGAGHRILFFSAAGEPLGEQQSDRGITDLLALPDGRVLGYQKDSSTTVVLARPDALAIVTPQDHETIWVKGASHANGLTVIWSAHAVFVLGDGDPQALPHWTTDYIREAVAWRDGILAWTGGELAMLELDGRVRWKVVAYDVLPTADHIIITRGDNTLTRLTPDGVEGRVLETGNIASGPSSEGYRRAWDLEGDRLFVARSTSSNTYEWDLATGMQIACVKTHECTSLAGCMRVAGTTATWAGQPIRGPRDTHVVLTRGAEVVDKLDAKDDVLAGVTVGDALAVRTKSKIFVWKTGKTQTFGHKGRVTGFLALPDSRLASWGVDKTLRIWAV
jgi:hypothetical protein